MYCKAVTVDSSPARLVLGAATKRVGLWQYRCFAFIHGNFPWWMLVITLYVKVLLNKLTLVYKIPMKVVVEYPCNVSVLLVSVIDVS